MMKDKSNNDYSSERLSDALLVASADDETLTEFIKACLNAGAWEAQDECLGNANIHRPDIPALLKRLKNSIYPEPAINRYLILQHTRDLVPQRKGPYNSREAMEQSLREIYELYPHCIAIVADMPETSYPEHGFTWIDINADRRKKHPRNKNTATPDATPQIK
jgi:hypothetical protein